MNVEEMNKRVSELETVYLKEENIINTKLTQFTDKIISFLSDKNNGIDNIENRVIIYCANDQQNYRSSNWKRIFKYIIQNGKEDEFIEWLCNEVARDNMGDKYCDRFELWSMY